MAEDREIRVWNNPLSQQTEVVVRFGPVMQTIAEIEGGKPVFFVDGNEFLIRHGVTQEQICEDILFLQSHSHPVENEEDRLIEDSSSAHSS